MQTNNPRKKLNLIMKFNFLWELLDGLLGKFREEVHFLLRDEFGEYFMSCSGPINLPPRSYDLMILDYFCGLYWCLRLYRKALFNCRVGRDIGRKVGKDLPKLDLRTLNYIDCTFNSNKEFHVFSEFYLFFLLKIILHST